MKLGTANIMYVNIKQTFYLFNLCFFVFIYVESQVMNSFVSGFFLRNVFDIHLCESAAVVHVFLLHYMIL